MKKSRFFKFASASILGAAVTIGLSSCSIPYQSNSVLRTYSSTDFLSDNNSPLNSAFNNSPISTYAQSAIYNLTTYQTVGDFAFDENGNAKSVTSDYLTLEAAKAVFVFKDDATATAIDNYLKSKDSGFDLSNESLSDESYNKLFELLKASEIDTTRDSTKTTFKEGTDYWVFQRKDGALQFQNGIDNKPWTPTDNSKSSKIDAEGQPNEVTVNSQTEYYKNAISSGTVYQFIIDTNNQWVDSNGNKKQVVSSKDFERSIEIYSLASDLNYNRNGYFLSLIGLNFDKTVGYTTTESNSYEKNGSIDWKEYDTTNFKNKNNNIFTLYIDVAYPYTFGLLSKEYFAALPYTNQKIKNINLKSGYIKTTSDGTIDQSATSWNEIYGSGQLGQFTKDVWYAGAYYVSAFTSANLMFQLNNTYMDTVGKDLLDYSNGSTNKNLKESRIKTISISYGSGTDDTFYELFKSKQNDFLSVVPSNRMSEASKLFKDNGLVPKKTVQANKSNYIVYTPTPYVTSGKNIEKNEYLGNMAQFIYEWNSKESYIIRSAISGLVNWQELSSINLPSSGDFQLSATPYGVFNGYYEQVANGNLYGGLPRSYSDYESTNSELSEFKVPYYTYSSSGVTVEDLTINKSTLQKALEHFGATKSNPLEFSIKFGETFTSNYQNFLNRMSQVIESISGGLIKVSIIQRLATSPSSTDWYNKQSSPLGFSYWSPDYNGVGTWIEADTTLQTSQIDGKDVEAVPATNAHNSYLTFLSSMVSAVKVMGATWNSTTNKYEVSSLPIKDSSQTNIFDNDSRIASAFSDETLTALGVELKTITTSSSYDESSAIYQGVSAGNRYGLLAIGLLNKLISNNVFDQSKFDAYVKDPSKLNTSSNAPSTIDQLYIGNDVIKSGQSSSFSKWLGVYAGEGTAKALYENTVLDSDYSYLPRSESGLNDIIYSLVNPNYVARVGTQSTNYRDFGIKD